MYMVINVIFIILQECDSTASFNDIEAGKFEVVLSHPEALLSAQALDAACWTAKISARE